MTRPGLPIFSPAWFDEHLTDCPEPLRPVVVRICEAFQLGNTSEPNTVARLIEEGLLEVFGKAYVLDEGKTRVTVDALCYTWPGVWYFTTLSGREVDFDEVEGREEIE